MYGTSKVELPLPTVLSERVFVEPPVRINNHHREEDFERIVSGLALQPDDSCE